MNWDHVKPFRTFPFLLYSLNIFEIVFLSRNIPTFINSPWILLIPQYRFSFFIRSISCFVSVGVSGLPRLFFCEGNVQYRLIRFRADFSTVSGFTIVKWRDMLPRSILTIA